MALVLHLLCHPNAAGVRWLNSAPMLHLGALSYSTYLWHQLPVGGARYKLANLDPLFETPSRSRQWPSSRMPRIIWWSALRFA
jgi:peptidoglycan/LPS O-acetylase OafA/YrhL